jgi:hypothetical protein
MKAILLLTFFSALAFESCTKEAITIYYAYIKNKTTHQIQIKPYSSGGIVTANIISLSPDQEIKISDDGFVRGIALNSGFGSKYFAGVDSLVVVFDNLYSITHYSNTPVSLAPKYYFFSSNRNIGNKYSYVLIGEDSKHKRINSYYYDFTEQDYLDAK